MMTLTKPFDIALTAVVQAREEARTTRQPVTFMFRQMPCCIFTTPTGQLRYQVGIHGKPSRNDEAMIKALADLERDAQAFAARGTRVPMVADVNYNEGQAQTVLQKSHALLRLPTQRD